MNTIFVNLADMPDPSDPAGRSYRQVNAEKTHAVPLGALVELESGVRLFVVKHTRDCDQTPLYSLAHEPLEEQDPLIGHYKWSSGHDDEGMTVIRLPASANE